MRRIGQRRTARLRAVGYQRRRQRPRRSGAFDVRHDASGLAPHAVDLRVAAFSPCPMGRGLLPDLQAGDLLAVENAGAYGFTESMPLFLSHARPAEILLLDGEAHVLRPRFEAERILDDQAIPGTLAPAASA